jgi:fluoride exporter
MDESVRLGITTGFLGSYTTFSTLCKESVALLTKGDYFSALSYITMSTVLGLTGVYLGIIVAREVLAKVIKGNNSKTGDSDVV